MSDSVDVGQVGLVVVQVPDVVGDEGVTATGDAEGVLQAGPIAEHGSGDSMGSAIGTGT